MPHPSLEKIHAAIPHRPPMLLLDCIVSQEEKSIVCQKTFVGDEFFFQGHYPGQPIVPGVILCECGAQAGAVMLSGLMASDGDQVPVLTRMNDVKFKKIVVPGDTVEVSVRLDEIVSSAYFMTAQIRVDGKLAVRLSLACSVASPTANK